MSKRFAAAVAVAAVASGAGGYTVANAVSRAEPYTASAISAADIKFSKPANNTWYTISQLTVPAGTWRLSYRVIAYSSRPKTDTGTVSAITTLTTQPGAATDRRFTAMSRVGGNSYRLVATLSAEEVISLDTPTTYYLVISESEGNNWDSLQALGASWSPTEIRAEQLQ